MRVPSTPASTPAELRGLWRRSLLQRQDSIDRTTFVVWLQSQAAYIDLRQPHPPRDFSHVRSFEDLSRSDCEWLARQEGFAGTLTCDGKFFEWGRRIDYQPAAALPDAGTLHWQDEVLIEHGRHADYLEHWHRDGGRHARPEACEAREWHDPRTGAACAYVAVGAHFMLARARSVPLESGATLLERVREADSTAAARALLDCEISFGCNGGGALRITHSTLPFRVGLQLRAAASDLMPAIACTAR